MPKIVFNKAAFFRDVNYRPHVGQVRVHASRAPRRVLACGVRWGKSKCSAMEALAAAIAPAERSIGWVVAPTYDLADKVYREVIITIGNNLKDWLISVREKDKTCIIRNMAGGESEIRAKSADNPVSLLGEGLNWLIVDEAARLKPNIWESYLSQRLIDKRGWALFISTPNSKNWFYDIYKMGQGKDSDYESWNSPTWENPHIDKRFIDKERDRLPASVFAQEYEAQFHEGFGSVFRNVRDCATGDYAPPIDGETYFGGIDFAKVDDFTVITVMNRKREVVYVERITKLNWDAQFMRMRAVGARYNNCIFHADATTSGERLCEELRRAGVRIRPFVFTNQSKNDLINNLVLLFERNEIVIPQPTIWPEGVDELEQYAYDIAESGAMKMGAPKGAHDDCVTSLALAAWPFRRSTKPFVIVA